MDQGQQNIPRMVEGFLAPILTTKSENVVSPTEQCYEDEINKGYAHSQLTMKSKKKKKLFHNSPTKQCYRDETKQRIPAQ